MNYNVYFKGYFATTSVLDISEEHLGIMISAYMNGESKVTLTGKQYGFKDVSEFRIFTNETGKSGSELERYLEQAQAFSRGFGTRYLDPDILVKLGNEVTYDKIGNVAYGLQKVKIIDNKNDKNYINEGRIDALSKISSNDFDLIKLIQLCKELNSNWHDENFFTVGLLLRTIINHVPPIFGAFTTFEQAIGGYGSQSFKKTMKALNESMRSIADSYTHQIIRKRESLPNANQVNFIPNVDVLIGEIIIILQK